MPSALAVRLARPRLRSSARVRATTSAGVSRSSASEGSSSTPKGMPASRAAATWRAQLPSPKEGSIASGRRERQGVGAGAVAVGDDRDVALRHAGEQALELARRQQRAVDREQHDALGAELLGAGDAGEGRARVAALVGIGDQLGAGARSRARSRAARW